MYRCYFMRQGRVAHGCNLKVTTLDAAIATGRKILADDMNIDDCDGLEIWLDRALLYKFGVDGAVAGVADGCLPWEN